MTRNGKMMYDPKYITEKAPKCYDGRNFSNVTYDEVGQWDMKIGDSFKIGSFFYLHYWKDCFWFRFFDGYGLHVRKPSWNGHILFSERNGYTKVYKICGYKIKVLKPSK